MSQQHSVAAKKELKLLEQYESKAFQAANLDAYRQQMIELDETFGALLKQLPKELKCPAYWKILLKWPMAVV